MPVQQRHLEKMEIQNQIRLETKAVNDGYSHPDPHFTAQVAVQHRKKLRTQMLTTGASEREVGATLRIFDSIGMGKALGAIGKRNPRVYILPEWAERRIIRGQPVWMIGSHWESIVVKGGCPMVPIHVWFVTIRGVWPYDVLHSEHCS